MNFLSLAPKIITDLLRFVPSIIFELIDWKVLAREFPILARRIVDKEGRTQLIEDLILYLPPQYLITKHGEELTKTPPYSKKLMGDHLIQLFFRTIFHSPTLFIDFRSTHFSYAEEKLLWCPSGPWYQFSPDFHQGLKDIYAGFYLGNEKTFKAGLLRTGLMNEAWPLEDKEKIQQLFKDHFGPVLVQEVKFSIEEFHRTFFLVFEFLSKKKVRLVPDFFALGVMLVTLYMHLEELNEVHDVLKQFKLSVSSSPRE